MTIHTSHHREPLALDTLPADLDDASCEHLERAGHLPTEAGQRFGGPLDWLLMIPAVIVMGFLAGVGLGLLGGLSAYRWAFRKLDAAADALARIARIGRTLSTDPPGVAVMPRTPATARRPDWADTPPIHRPADAAGYAASPLVSLLRKGRTQDAACLMRQRGISVTAAIDMVRVFGPRYPQRRNGRTRGHVHTLTHVIHPTTPHGRTTP